MFMMLEHFEILTITCFFQSNSADVSHKHTQIDAGSEVRKEKGGR
jgi:hypothetical protein